MKAIRTAIAMTLAAMIGVTNAAPATRVDLKPSAIYIIASNPEDRAYNCSISLVWSHDDFGTRKQQSVNTTAFVKAKLDNGIIWQMSGGVVNVQIDNGPNIQCT